MSIKHSLSLGIVALASSSLSLAGYKFFLEEKYPVKEIIVRESSGRHALAVGHNSRPFSPGPLIGSVESFTETARKVRPAVVHIRSISSSEGDVFGFDMSSSSGSGVIIDSKGYIITNNHVIDGAEKVRIILNDRRSFIARVIGSDASTDLAVVKIAEKDLDGIKLETLNYGNSDELEVGEWVLAVGNPFNLTSTVTAGIVSAKGRNIDILKGNYSVESFIQTDAAVNPGNSGGALVDARGNLVGINTAIITRSGRYEGYSFAVPANLVRKVTNDLIEFGLVKRGFLGVLIKDVDSDIAAKYKLSNLNGVLLEKVNSGSAADAAGLKEGDVVVRINDVLVSSSPELQEQVALFRPGESIRIEFLREGKRLEVEAILKNASGKAQLDEDIKARSERFQSKKELQRDLGFTLRNLKETEQRRLKKTGVYVETVKRNSLIDRTNMERSFIITAVNGEEVSSVDELEETILAAENEVELLGFYEKFKGEYSYSFEKR